MPQQRKKEESERLRGERDQIKFIDPGFERWQVVRFRKAIGRQGAKMIWPQLALFPASCMNFAVLTYVPSMTLSCHIVGTESKFKSVNSVYRSTTCKDSPQYQVVVMRIMKDILNFDNKAHRL